MPRPTVTQNFEEQAAAAIEAEPAVFSFVFGIPSPDILRSCRRKGIVTIGGATTVDEAIALEQAGVDVVVASGFEAGGARPSFLKPAEESLVGTFALVPQILDKVKLPVIAAGGIADGRGVAAALTLGADAVQIGTAFFACDESGAKPIEREALFQENAKYTALSRVFTGRLARNLQNRFTSEMKSHEAHLPDFPAQAWLSGTLREAALAQGRTDLLWLWSGQAAPLLRHHKAGELIAALAADADRLLSIRMRAQ
jgi:nitronate monooxygenase